MNKNDKSQLTLLVKSNMQKQQIKKLSIAIQSVVQRYGSAQCRCIGASSVYNATKALIIANFGRNKSNQPMLISIPSFSVIQSGTVTAVIIDITTQGK